MAILFFHHWVLESRFLWSGEKKAHYTDIVHSPCNPDESNQLWNECPIATLSFYGRKNFNGEVSPQLF